MHATGDPLGRTVEIPDLGTTTVAEWTRITTGHLVGHVDQAAAPVVKPNDGSVIVQRTAAVV